MLTQKSPTQTSTKPKSQTLHFLTPKPSNSNLLKLLKLDFKWTYKHLPFYLLGLAITTLLYFLCSRLPVVPLTTFLISYIFPNIIIALTISGLINLFIRTIVRFGKNFYGDEAYLTHTLPIKKSTLLLSKVLTAATTLPIAFLVICYALPATDLNFRLFFEAAKNYAKSFPLEIFLTLSITFFQFMYIYLCAFYGILLGHKRKTHKKLHSALSILGLYFGIALLFLATLKLISLFIPSVGGLFENGNNFIVHPTLYIALGFYILTDITLYYLTQKSFRKGIDVN